MSWIGMLGAALLVSEARATPCPPPSLELRGVEEIRFRPMTGPPRVAFLVHDGVYVGEIPPEGGLVAPVVARPATDLDWSLEGDTLYAFHPEGVSAIDPETGAVRWFAARPLWSHPAHSGVGGRVAALADDETVVWDARDGSVVTTLPTKFVTAMALSPDGGRLVVERQRNGTDRIELWDVDAGKRQWSVDSWVGGSSLDHFRWDGDRIVLVSDAALEMRGRATAFDSSTGAQVGEASIAPSGHHVVATSGGDLELYVGDLVLDTYACPGGLAAMDAAGEWVVRALTPGAALWRLEQLFPTWVEVAWLERTLRAETASFRIVVAEVLVVAGAARSSARYEVAKMLHATGPGRSDGWEWWGYGILDTDLASLRAAYPEFDVVAYAGPPLTGRGASPAPPPSGVAVWLTRDPDDPCHLTLAPWQTGGVSGAREAVTAQLDEGAVYRVDPWPSDLLLPEIPYPEHCTEAERGGGSNHMVDRPWMTRATPP